MSDTLIIGGTTYNNVAGFKATDSNDNMQTFIRPTGTKQINENGTGIDVSAFAAVDVNVPGGAGVDYWQYVKQLSYTFWDGVAADKQTLPDLVELYLPTCVKADHAFTRQNTITGNDLKVTLHFNDAAPTIKDLSYCVYQTWVKEARITGDLSGVTTYQYLFHYTNNIRKVDAELDFSSCTTANSVNIGNGGGTTLTYLRYKANTLSISQNLSSQRVLDEDSLVSIANGLNESATGQTLTLYSTRKDLCDSIMGTVAMDGTNTYHVFTRDAGGSVSLSDFITTTKGWTLA